MPDFDLDAELDKQLGPSPQAQSDDIESELDAQLGPAPKPHGHVIEMPTQTIVGDVPAKPKPAWYSRFLPSSDALLHGAAQGVTLNFGDEGAAALSSVSPQPKDPEGFGREYKAGSQYEDMRRGLQAEDDKLRQEHPGAFIAGQVLGAAPAAIATTPVAGAARGALGAATSLGPKALNVAEAAMQGSGLGALAGAGAAPPGERLKGAAVGGAEGAVSGAALQGVGQGVQDVADNSTNVANRLLTQTFMTPAQRSRYTLAKGPKALDQLGADARDAGLFGGKLRQLLPTRAKTVANRAVDVMNRSGNKITDFENGLTERGINPDVDVRPVVKDLRSAAADENVPAVDAEGATRLLNKQADLLEQPSSATVTGKIERPPALPEWSLNQPKAPKYTAAIEPQQEPLPGTEYQHAPAVNPQPYSEPVQTEMNLPRAMPDKQLALDTAPAATRPVPAQMQMDLGVRQSPSVQTQLPLAPQQAKLPLPPAEAPKNLRPQMTLDQLPVRLPSGGAAQEPMFQGTEPARPPAPPPPPPAPEQMFLDLPARQVPMNLPPSRPNPFVPGDRSAQAQQMNLPTQGELSLPVAPKPAVAQPAQPAASGQQSPVAGQQEGLPLDNPNRGPQPELSTPLPNAQAQIARESMPFSDATKLKRFLGRRIDWQKNPNAKASKYEQDAVRKTTWKGISDQIDEALKGDQRISPEELAGYGKAKRDFHTAATAFDPAIKMAEREGEVGLGARDMLAAAAFGGNPATGALAALGNKQVSGVLPSVGASGVRAVGAGASGLAPLLKGAAKVTPIAQAREQNPGAREPDVKRKANENVRKDLARLLESPK